MMPTIRAGEKLDQERLSEQELERIRNYLAQYPVTIGTGTAEGIPLAKQLLGHADSLARQLTEYELALKRKSILDNYGITIENVKFDEWLDVISSDERLNKWFGEPLPDYIISEFKALNKDGV